MNHRTILCVMAALTLACGTTHSAMDGDLADAGPSSSDASLFPTDAGPASGDAGTLTVDAGLEAGPRVYVHLRASHAAVSHAPETSGQTPRDWWSGIRSLHLLRTMDDPAPERIFDHGDGYVEASYGDGDDTIVGSAPIASLPTGTFTYARVVHSHVRFTIDATSHSAAGVFPGQLDDLIVLSDRTTLDGVAHDRGFYRYVFRAAGFEYPAQGDDFTVLPISGGGFNTQVEDGQTAYYFAAPLEVRDDLDTDVHMIFEVNVHEGFRWTDLAAAGYAEDVFDVAFVGPEPIVQAGANSYTYRVE